VREKEIRERGEIKEMWVKRGEGNKGDGGDKGNG